MKNMKNMKISWFSRRRAFMLFMSRFEIRACASA